MPSPEVLARVIVVTTTVGLRTAPRSTRTGRHESPVDNTLPGSACLATDGLLLAVRNEDLVDGRNLPLAVLGGQRLHRLVHRHLDVLAGQKVLRHLPERLDGAVEGGRHLRVPAEHQPELARPVAIDRVAVLVDEDVPAGDAGRARLDREHHRLLPVRDPVEDRLGPLVLLADDVLEQRAVRRLALQGLGRLEDDDPLLPVVLLDREHADGPGLLAHLRQGRGREVDVPAGGYRRDRRDHDYAGDAGKQTDTHKKPPLCAERPRSPAGGGFEPPVRCNAWFGPTPPPPTPSPRPGPGRPPLGRRPAAPRWTA